MYCSRHVSEILSRHFRKTNVQCAAGKQQRFLFLSQCRSYGSYGSKFRRRQIGAWLKDQSIQVARACTKQLEFVVAQRVRRTIQIFHLYTKIWDEVALRDFLRAWRRRIARNWRQSFIGAAVGVSGFDWDKERISEDEIHDCYREIDAIRNLKDSTVVCPRCHLRLVIDTTQQGVEYCKCYAVAVDIPEEEWKPFIERKDMIVWRKAEESNPCLYAYKVYGSFEDVSAHDFLQVQIDVDYRKEWDYTAKELKVIESDPSTSEANGGCNDIIYWEMVWPRLFANRDYVYQRKWSQDKDSGMIVIISRVTNHPEVPERQDTHRVSNYWSCIVIKPYTDFHEKGIEFSLTYFDDPGINIPSAIRTWVAMSGFPDYLCRMRDATKGYQQYMSSKEEAIVPKPSIELDNNSDSEQSITFSPNEESKETSASEKDAEDEKANEEQIAEDSEIDLPENQGFLGFFFFTRLFA